MYRSPVGQRRNVIEPATAGHGVQRRGRFVAVYDEGNSWQDRYKGYKRLAYGAPRNFMLTAKYQF